MKLPPNLEALAKSSIPEIAATLKLKDPTVDQLQAAVAKKADAVFKICVEANLQNNAAHRRMVMEALWRKFGNASVSALDTLEPVNLMAHSLHTDLIQSGWSYGAVTERYHCDSLVKGELFTLAVPHSDLRPTLERVAELLAKGKLNGSDALVDRLLRDLGRVYAALHIKESYEAEHRGSMTES